MSDPFVICSNLSFSWPDDTPVFQDLSFTAGGERTGLVDRWLRLEDGRLLR
jgi:hypothetical protein